MRVAILQTCYIPWRGYFDIIGAVDTFVVYDDVQYSKNHWYNRNRIKTANGTHWLTIPVSLPNGLQTTIEDVEVSSFADKHWASISQAYARAPYFKQESAWFKELLFDAGQHQLLSDANCMLLGEIAHKVGIKTRIIRSSSLGIEGDQTGRLVDICSHLGATTYLSGPAAKTYLQAGRFTEAGIAVEWMDYAGYAEYPQLHGPFEPAVSIIDLLFNTGPDAVRYMKFRSKDDRA